MADLDFKSAAKKVGKAVVDTYNSPPSGQQVSDNFDTASAALKSFRDMQPGQSVKQAAPVNQNDIMSAVIQGAMDATGYYRGYVKPKLERAWRDVTRAFK